MKYRIDGLVINSDHIVRVDYFPATPDDTVPEDRLSACGIRTTSDLEDNDRQWNIWLRGDKADRFWAVYISDALDVMAEEEARK